MAVVAHIVESPFGQDVLLVRRLSGQEELGRAFKFELDFECPRRRVSAADLLGRGMGVRLELPDGRVRHFHGLVAELEARTEGRRTAEYRATLRPWLWFASHTSRCRVFQHRSVPEILAGLFHERGGAFGSALVGSHDPRDYLVQYRESDFAFISRMLEEEGIYYYFRHEHDRHTLILADGYGSHEPTPGYEAIPYFPESPGNRRVRDNIERWRTRHRVGASGCVLDDYDYRNPRADLQVRMVVPLGYEQDDEEMYDYPGGYVATGRGEHLAKTRLESMQVNFERISAHGTVRGLEPGALFSLTDHPRADQNREYLVVAAHYELDAGEYESSEATRDGGFRCTLEAIPSATPFRLERVTPRPVVSGPETATVVGQAGKELHTNEHGSVKVQFRWDREGTLDENSSCWVRVAQPWAGSGWGALHVPRVGQEVVVGFLEGDPDRPLILGSVYNGAHKPPFPLPDAAMVSGVKTDSTPGGCGYNELSFDDTRGAERFVVHAQRDMDAVVERDQALTIRRHRTEQVDGEHREHVGGSQRISVDVNQELCIAGDHAESVGRNATETVGAAKSVEVATTLRVSVGQALQHIVGGDKVEQVGQSACEEVGASKRTVVGEDLSLQVAGATSLRAGGAVTVRIDEDACLTGKKRWVVDVGDELTIRVGESELVMKKSGEISLKGKKVSVQAASDLSLKARKIAQNK